MPGTGEYVTDFVFAPDLAWLLTTPLKNRKAIGQVYNATGEGAVTLNTYVKMLSKIIGQEPEVIHYDPEILQDDKMKPENWNQMFPFAYDSHLILSKEKSVVDLDYKPISFVKGEKITFEWYKENRNPDWKGDYKLDKKIAKKISKQ